jgi:hypothetical protein
LDDIPELIDFRKNSGKCSETKKDPHQNIQPTSVTELNEQTEDTQKTNDHT